MLPWQHFCQGVLGQKFQFFIQNGHFLLQNVLTDGPLFFLLGGYHFHKKTLALKKYCLLQGYEFKKLSAKQREIFWNRLIFQNFDTIELDIKVSFSFI